MKRLVTSMFGLSLFRYFAIGPSDAKTANILKPPPVINVITRCILAIGLLLVILYASKAQAVDECQSQPSLILDSMGINGSNGHLDTKWKISIGNCQKPYTSGAILYEIHCPNPDGAIVFYSETRLAWPAQTPTTVLLEDSKEVPSEQCEVIKYKVESCYCFENVP